MEIKARFDHFNINVTDLERSLAFYDTTTFWQWMRMPGDVVFAAGALLMAWDFLAKLWGQRRTRLEAPRRQGCSD